MKLLLGKKLEMTQVYNDKEEVVPVTKVLVEPCFVTQVKKTETDGYTAIQVGTKTDSKSKHIKMPQKGHLKDLAAMNLTWLKEFLVDSDAEAEKYKVGDSIEPTIFGLGEKVDVIGVTKGRGFQGVVKRHGFGGSPATHGHKDQLRMPGSIGATHPNRVFKGVRMGGHMGADRKTIKNLEVVAIDKKFIYIKGAIPGARNSLVIICQK